MSSYNRVIMIGNLTRDPDYKQLASGQGVCRLGLASNRQFKNRQTGSMTQEVCFIDIDVWGPQAESCKQYLQKGKSILVEGRLKFDSWQDPQGATRSKHSIVADRVTFLSGSNAAENSSDFESRTDEDDGGGLQLNPNNPVEKDLLDQLDQAKAKIKAVKKTAEKKVESRSNQTTSSFDSGEIDFADTPPFEDNLPF